MNMKWTLNFPLIRGVENMKKRENTIFYFKR